MEAYSSPHLILPLGSIIGSFFGLIFGLLYFGFFAAAFYGLWKVFEKAGKPGWAAFIPIYNIFVLHEIVGREPIKILLLLIPFVGLYFSITLLVSLAKSFGKTETGEYMLTVFFYPFYLGLGSARYVGPSEGPGAVVDNLGVVPRSY